MLAKGTMIDLYKKMMEIRLVEQRIADHYNEDEMRTPVHLYIGQEAIAAGVCANLQKEDYVFSNHRNHGHYIAKGGDLNAMIAELYNRATGCSKGRGGSMHLIDLSVGFHGSSSIVAGGVPIATGAALASVMKGENRVSAVFFGDAASEEGVVYESICFAALKKLPIVYICENNQYSVCSPLKNRQADNQMYKKFEGLPIKTYCLDGNNVIDVYTAFNKIIEDVREKQQPVFVECVTYRMMDHHGTKTGVEVGYRTQEEWDEWKGKDPIGIFENILYEQKLLDEKEKAEIVGSINQRIDQAFEFAKKSPLPDISQLCTGLFR